MMKRRMMAAILAVMMTAAAAGCGKGGETGTVYKVGIVRYVDDASLNQIEKIGRAHV